MMSSKSDAAETRPRKRVRRRVLLAAAAALFCFLTLALDQHYRHSELPGFCPASATWFVGSADFPGFWSAWRQLPEVVAAREALAGPLGGAGIAFRKAFHVPLTPACWNFLLGRRLMAAGDGQDVVLCFRPGLPLRVADRLRSGFGMFSRAPKRFGPLYYQWRDGFLLVSASETFLLVAQGNGVTPSSLASLGQGMTLAWTQPVRGSLVCEPDALHAWGRLDTKMTASRAPLRFADAWPVPPLVSLGAKKPGEVVRLVEQVCEPLEDGPLFQAISPAVETLTHAWTTTTSGELAWPNKEMTLALLAMQLDDAGMPVPVLGALAEDTAKPSAAERFQNRYGPVIPHGWDAYSGWILPWWGERFSICVAQDNTLWMASSQEPALAGMAGHVSPVRSPGHIAFRMDCARLAPVLESLLGAAARDELLPRCSEEDVATFWAPYCRALGALKAFRLDGFVQDDGTLRLELRAGKGAESQDAVRNDTETAP